VLEQAVAARADGAPGGHAVYEVLVTDAAREREVRTR